ncbi:MAG: EAL domain-containing protein [Sulfuricaulis sp.]
MNNNSKFIQTTDALRVLLVDDNAGFISAVSRHLALQPWARVVGSAGSAAEAIRLAQQLAPDVILMDVMMPDMNGIEATREFKRQPDAPRVVILTLHDNAEYRYHARLAGADGFVAKSEFEAALPLLIERLFSAPRPIGAVPDDREWRVSELAHAALRESEERLRVALEAGDMGIFDWNIATGVLTWSLEHARIFGLRPEQFDGSYESFTRCVHPEDLPELIETMNSARRDRTLFRHKYRVICPDGSQRWIHGKGRFTYDVEGNATRMTGVVVDISDTMRMLRDLDEKKSRLCAIFDNDPQCIKLIDRQGIIREINRAGANLLAVENPEALIGKSMLEFIVPDQRETMQAYLESVLNGNRGDLEFEVVRADGLHRWFESLSVPINNPANDETLALAISLDITERRRTEERLSFLSNHDGLTGLPNRHLFTDRLQQAMIEADRHGRFVGVAFLDLDRFKNINDTLGHDTGDAALIAAANRLREAVRPSDTVARLGGDEFAFVLADMAKPGDAPIVVQRILNTFLNPFVIDGREHFLSACLGITLYPVDETNAEALLSNADNAMHRAKESGRSSCQFYTAEMTRRAHEDMALEGALRRAIARNELALHYQPIVNLTSGHILGLEALLRWQHPERGLISPAHFIPLAEESGLIIPIGAWALKQACVQMRNWRDTGYNDLHVSVNMSSRQFREPDLAEWIMNILADTGLEGLRLEVELTESMLLTNVENTVGLMRQLDAGGVRFAIDDFGTGYSSLSYLKRFPIDVLKIDQSFVRDITTDSDDAAIVRAIITMAHSLGIQTVAEGVETGAQLKFLRENGCDAIQGYYFSKPLPAEDITRLLAGKKSLSMNDRRRNTNP